MVGAEPDIRFAEPALRITPRQLSRLTLQALAATRACVSGLQTEAQNHVIPRFVGMARQDKVFQLSAEEVGDSERWFVVGDIHGDFYALSNLVDHIESVCPDFRLVFLGDLVDRGPHSEECFWFLVDLARRYPDRVLWIAGNHDAGVAYEETRGQFVSSVSPAEFVEYLNGPDGTGPVRHELGHAFLDTVARLPRAVLFPDGLLATHGGFPHTDLQQLIVDRGAVDEGLRWLNDPRSLQDFTWTRISRYRMKIPNRYSTGCQYGFADFQSFCETVGEFFPAKRLVTGHEHPAGGVDEHKEWVSHPALTLTGFAFADNYLRPEAFFSQYRKYLVCARLRAGLMPEVLRIQVDRADLEIFYSSGLEPRFNATNEK